MFKGNKNNLPAESGISAEPATDTVPGVADAEVGAVGCNRTVGPVGRSHLHPVDHTEVASVGKKEPQQI